MLIRAVFVVGVFLAAALSVPLKSKNDEDSLREEVRELLDYLKEDQPDDELSRIDHLEKGKRLFRKYFGEEKRKNNDGKKDKAEKGKKKEKPGKPSDMIDEEDVDPNDEKLMKLLEGMAVEKNGKVYQVRFGLCILMTSDNILTF
uniref:Uncharacterized protein n=1 Tax=Magallana gigas TaxID=29159 RepID=A0A8W8IFI1_MAGGI|nr:uncharacterized protein LOC117690036 [Crassostrea gigas]